MLNAIEKDNRSEINNLVDLFHKFSQQEAALATTVVEIGKALSISKKKNLFYSLHSILAIPQNYINYFKELYNLKKNRPPNYLKLLENYLLNPPSNERLNPIQQLTQSVNEYFSQGANSKHYTEEQKIELHKMLSLWFRFSSKELDLRFLDPMRFTYCLVCGARPTDKGLNIAYSKKVKLPIHYQKSRFVFNDRLSYYPFPICDECFSKVGHEKNKLKYAAGKKDVFQTDFILSKFSYRMLSDIYLLSIEKYFELHRILTNGESNCACESIDNESLILQITRNL